MSCQCEEYVCVEAFINPCSEGVEVDIVSDFTGNITGRIWMNGSVSTFTIGVEDQEKIIIPSQFLNENYTHELRLYKGGVIWGCYRVKTYLDFESPIYEPMPISVRETFVRVITMGSVIDLNTVYGSSVAVPNGHIIQYNDLIGAELLEVQNVTEDLAPITGMGVDGFDATTGTITLSNAYSDTFFIVTYKKQA